jgi:hypothetical protein
MADLAPPSLGALTPAGIDTGVDLALVFDVSANGLGKITVADLLSLAAAPASPPLNGLPATDLTATGVQTASYAAGATITPGQIVYLGAASKWLLSNAAAVGTSGGMVGIALESKTDTQPLNVLLKGFMRNDAWAWTPGATVYLGATAATLTATPPITTDSVTRVAGWATTADVIWFAPSPDYLTHI